MKIKCRECGRMVTAHRTNIYRTKFRRKNEEPDEIYKFIISDHRIGRSPLKPYCRASRHRIWINQGSRF